MSPEIANVLRAAVVVAAFTIWALLTVWLRRRHNKRRGQKALEAWDDKTRYGNHPGALPEGEPHASTDAGHRNLRDGRGRPPSWLHGEALGSGGEGALRDEPQGAAREAGGAASRAEGAAQTPRVEGDLELDDARPTDPGEEITEVSRYSWDEESGMQPAARKLGRMTGPDRGRMS